MRLLYTLILRGIPQEFGQLASKGNLLAIMLQVVDHQPWVKGFYGPICTFRTHNTHITHAHTEGSAGNKSAHVLGAPRGMTYGAPTQLSL